VTKNVTEAVRHLEDAAKLGHTDAKTALGHHAYHTEKNYTKAAAYWQECYNEAQNIYCAHNLVCSARNLIEKNKQFFFCRVIYGQWVIILLNTKKIMQKLGIIIYKLLIKDKSIR